MSILAIVFDESNIDEMQGWSKSISNSLSLDSSIYFIGDEPEKIREDLLCVPSDDALDLIKKEIESNYSNNSKLILIREISKVVENFFKKKVIIRVRDYFDHS